MLDLSGTPSPWPGDIEALWSDAAATQDISAADGPDAWRATVAAMLGAGSGDRLQITAGVRPVVAAFADLGRTVLLEGPTFAGVRRAFERAGRPVTIAQLDELLRQAKPAARTLIWLTSPGRNPDGWTAGPEFVTELEGFIADGGLVVQNETYRWHGPPAPPVPGAVRIGSLAKVAGPHRNIGWLLGSPEVTPTASRIVSAPGREVQAHWARFAAAGGLDLLARRARAVAATTGRARSAIAGGDVQAAWHGASFLLRIPGADAAAVLERAGVKAGPGPAFHAASDTARLCFLGCDADCAHDAQLARLAERLGARIAGCSG
ncbi:MAG: hypothetical protein JWN03_1000 [Nocardia sp.]|uniref:hypothetical protein n=1 Tax=Nocardia sp. TaxID=1821 RepID=UPI002620751C|nr:hypothetical protein [Nocardia sp.]MCU1640725.1 hypothetical protein [Nocardia sp.]